MRRVLSASAVAVLAVVVPRAALISAGLAACALGGAIPARAAAPGIGPAAVVAVGDSAISGEAGRSAGNTNDSYTRVDALGPTASPIASGPPQTAFTRLGAALSGLPLLSSRRSGGGDFAGRPLLPGR